MEISNSINTYQINEKLLKKHKVIAKKAYKNYIQWCKNKNHKSCPPEIGSAGSDFIIFYKTNGLKTFKNYLLFIKSTKEHLYFD